MTEEIKSDDEQGKSILGIIVIFIGLSILLFFAMSGPCHVKGALSKDLYCHDVSVMVDGFPQYRLDSHSADAKAAEESRAYEESLNKQVNASAECYNAGRDYNYSFDVIKDYGLTCAKLAYINDHLIDKTTRVDGGYIDGYSMGFLHYGHISGQLYDYVTEGTLATGQLVQNVQYHLDCENKTKGILMKEYWGGYERGYTYPVYTYKANLIYRDTKVIDYYTESEFVMYYVDHCIGGDK